AAFAAIATSTGVALRPHVKAHKSVRIARAQLDAGAIGLACATLAEAETMADAGLGPLLITGPVVGRHGHARLCALVKRSPGLAVVIDAPQTIPDLSTMLAAVGTTLDVLVDLDVGTGRTGATGIAGALGVATAVRASPQLRLRGVQGYAGHVQHEPDWFRRRALCVAVADRVKETVAALRADGHDIAIISGGGTGSAAIDVTLGCFTESQAGSYVFSDVQYDAVALERPGEGPRRIANALYVLSQVVSVRDDGLVTLDGGTKTFGFDRQAPRVVAGAPAGSVWTVFGDEFASLALTPGSPPMRLGDRMLFVVPHCDPTVALHDRYHVMGRDGLEGTWPVDARWRHR
ncbi:MAG: alanine racemase, partial [Gemmobacter sp.]